MKFYKTDSGLGYKEYAILLRLNKTENGYNYIVLDIHQSENSFYGDMYSVGKITDLEDYCVEEIDYDLKKSELYKSFLFEFFMKHYSENIEETSLKIQDIINTIEK